MLPSALRSTVALAVLALGVTGCAVEDDSGGAVAPAPALVKSGTLTVCTSLPYEPFEFEKDGKTVGFDIDLASEVAKRLDLETEFVNTEFDEIQSGELLNAGRCDLAVAGLTITGERARALDFSSPYFDAAQAMVVRADSGVSSLSDLGGGRIGVQEGTTGQIYLTDNAPSDASIVTFETAAQIDAALRDGDVDAGIYDNTVVGDVVSRYPDFQVSGEFATSEQYGMAVKKDSNVELLRTVNDVLAELQSNGRYDEIYEQWFGPVPTT